MVTAQPSFWSRPAVFRLLLNLYPPYLGTGIRVRTVAPDYRAILVEMPLRWYNRNYVNTHFGGSLYAMTDPFYMLMLIQNLGPEYLVWDQAARIEFVKPGTGRVQARFVVSEAQLGLIRSRTAQGEKYLHDFTVDVTDAKGKTVARVTKTLYVRRKKS